MNIWGRLIGTLFGLKVLGLFGAIVGYIIGSWFDRGVRLHVHTQSFADQFEEVRRRAAEYQTYQASQAYEHANYQRQPEFFTQSVLQDAYRVLDVLSTATEAEIKKAYRRLMNQHHPDKLASRELPEAMLRMAKEKTQQVRAAYDLIRKERGFR